MNHQEIIHCHHKLLFSGDEQRIKAAFQQKKDSLLLCLNLHVSFSMYDRSRFHKYISHIPFHRDFQDYYLNLDLNFTDKPEISQNNCKNYVIVGAHTDNFFLYKIEEATTFYSDVLGNRRMLYCTLHESGYKDYIDYERVAPWRILRTS